MKTVIEMAREVGMNVVDDQYSLLPFLERFAELVRADEREKCALVAEDSDHVVAGRGYYDQLGDADATVRNVAAAIRARSNT